MSRRDSAIVISTGTIRRVFLTFLAVALLALAAVVVRPYLQRGPGIADQIDHNAYQAGFLTGGQVFFGHAIVGDESLALSDVFYLAANTDATQPQQLGQLVKRGNELHGPREPMLVELKQVLFLENMRDDSQVVQAIKRFKTGDLPAATPTPLPPTAAPTARPSASR